MVNTALLRWPGPQHCLFFFAVFGHRPALSSADRPPQGTPPCRWGWALRWWPQGCSIALHPMSTPSCVGARPTGSTVSAPAWNSMAERTCSVERISGLSTSGRGNTTCKKLTGHHASVRAVTPVSGTSQGHCGPKRCRQAWSAGTAAPPWSPSCRWLPRACVRHCSLAFLPFRCSRGTWGGARSAGPYSRNMAATSRALRPGGRVLMGPSLAGEPAASRPCGAARGG